MGGEYNTRTYNGMLSRAEVTQRAEETRDEMGYESGHGYSGTWVEKDQGIDFCNIMFKSEVEADEWLCDNNDKWGRIGACFFTEKQGTDKQNLKIKNLTNKINYDNSVNEFLNTVLAKNKSVKAKTKKCKNCGTVHIVNLIGVKCTTCDTLFLNATEKKKLEKIQDKLKKEKIKLKTLIANKGGKTINGWLVGGWCSC